MVPYVVLCAAHSLQSPQQVTLQKAYMIWTLFGGKLGMGSVWGRDLGQNYLFNSFEPCRMRVGVYPPYMLDWLEVDIKATTRVINLRYLVPSPVGQYVKYCKMLRGIVRRIINLG